MADQESKLKKQEMAINDMKYIIINLVERFMSKAFKTLYSKHSSIYINITNAVNKMKKLPGKEGVKDGSKLKDMIQQMLNITLDENDYL